MEDPLVAAGDDLIEWQSPPLMGPTVNLACNLLGAGVLALPSCFQECGVINGLVLLVLCAAGADYTLHMLLHTVIPRRMSTV